MNISGQQHQLLSVEPTTALGRTTVAIFLLDITVSVKHLTNLIVVIVRQFLERRYIVLGKQHHVRDPHILMVVQNVLRVKIRRAAMVYKPPHVPFPRSVYGKEAILIEATLTILRANVK